MSEYAFIDFNFHDDHQTWGFSKVGTGDAPKEAYNRIFEDDYIRRIHRTPTHVEFVFPTVETASIFHRGLVIANEFFSDPTGLKNDFVDDMIEQSFKDKDEE